MIEKGKRTKEQQLSLAQKLQESIRQKATKQCEISDEIVEPKDELFNIVRAVFK